MIPGGRDRVLVTVLALQLLAATILAAVLVHGLSGKGSSGGDQLVSLGGSGTAGTASTTGGAAGSSGRHGTAGTAGGTAGAAGSGAAGSSGSSGGGGAASTSGGTAPASGTSGTAFVAKGAPIKIGAIVTQTGAINFAASAQGTKAYIDMVNSHGGVNGHRIALDLRDDQLDSTRGLAQAQQLVAEGVFTLAAFNAPETEADIVPFLERNRMPLVGNYGVGAEYHSEYSYPFQSHHYGYEMGRYLGLQSGVHHPGVIFIGNASSAVNAAQKRAFTAGVASTGKSLSSKDIVQVDVTKASYDDVVTQFRLDRVDGMATLIDQTAYNRLQQSMDRQGYHPVHIADPEFTDPVVQQSSSTVGTLVASDLEPIDYGGPAVQQYASTVRSEFGSSAQVSYVGEAGWLDAKILVDALRQLGTKLTRQHLQQVLDRMPASEGAGFTAPLSFGAGAHDINRCLQLSKVGSGGRLSLAHDWSCDSKTFD